MTPHQRQDLLRQIDQGSWKHSWHLPRAGHKVNWYDFKTYEQCLAVLNEQINEARETIKRCEPLQVLVVEEIERLKFENGNGIA